jgi:protein ImuB
VDGRRIKSEQLWLAVRLPHLPLDVLGVKTRTTPIVVSEKRRVDLVICLNEPAASAGVSFGMDCTKAQILGDCEVIQRDRARESRALTELADGLYRFSPYIEIYECDPIAQAGVVLEVSTCLVLFDGLLNLMGQMRQFLSTMEYSFELGIGHSAQAAWLLSWTDQTIKGGESRADFIEQLKPISLNLLHEHPDAVTMLVKTGFATLGDVARQIEGRAITGLKKRLSREFINYICDVFGIDQALQQKSLFQKPVTHYQPQEIYREEIEFEYPVANSELLHVPIETALQNLSSHMSRRQLECQEVTWVFLGIHDRAERIIVRCDAGQSDWRLLYDLTLIQLDSRTLTFEVDRLVLECAETTRLQDRRQTLNFTGSRAASQHQQDLEIALAKLKARLGDNAVFKMSYCDHHLPEAMAAAVPIAAGCNQALPDELATAVRPVWLFAQPYKAETRERGIYWRGYFELLVGPERIHGDWWEKPCARDYYLAQRDDAARFWVFQDIQDGNWYVQGEFA